jgi:hypothetical protein
MYAMNLVCAFLLSITELESVLFCLVLQSWCQELISGLCFSLIPLFSYSPQYVLNTPFQYFSDIPLSLVPCCLACHNFYRCFILCPAPSIFCIHSSQVCLDLYIFFLIPFPVLIYSVLLIFHTACMFRSSDL